MARVDGVAPKVTVLMAVYNGERYLDEAIQSILNQTFGDFEFLIIDDGSTDRSREIINSYSDLRIRLMTNECNMGLISSLNAGLNAARGEYLARMDADDVSLPERIERQVAFMDANLDVVVCGCWIRYFGERHIELQLPSRHEEIASAMLLYNPIAHPTAFLRRQWFIQHELYYDPAALYAEDYDLWARVLPHAKLANIPQVLLNYRVHGANVSILNRDATQPILDRIRRDLLQAIGLNPTKEELRLHGLLSNDAGREFIDLLALRCWIDKLKRAYLAKFNGINEKRFLYELGRHYAGTVIPRGRSFRRIRQVIVLTRLDLRLAFWAIMGSLIGWG